MEWILHRASALCALLAILSPQSGAARAEPVPGRNTAKLNCALGLRTKTPPFRTEISNLAVPFELGGVSYGLDRFLVLPTERNSQPGFYVYAEDKTYFVPTATRDELLKSGLEPQTASGKPLDVHRSPQETRHYPVEQWFKIPGEALARSITYLWVESPHDPNPNLIVGDPAISYAGGARSAPHVFAAGKRGQVLEITDQQTEARFQRALNDRVEAVLEQARRVNSIPPGSPSLAQEKLDFENFANARIWDCSEAASPAVRQKIEATMTKILRFGRYPAEAAQEVQTSASSSQ